MGRQCPLPTHCGHWTPRLRVQEQVGLRPPAGRTQARVARVRAGNRISLAESSVVNGLDLGDFWWRAERREKTKLPVGLAQLVLIYRKSFGMVTEARLCFQALYRRLRFGPRFVNADAQLGVPPVTVSPAEPQLKDPSLRRVEFHSRRVTRNRHMSQCRLLPKPTLRRNLREFTDRLAMLPLQARDQIGG